MSRRNILIWHIHGSYLNTLARIDHNWFLPVKAGRPTGYGGRGATFDLPGNVVEVPAERVRDLDLDLVIYQTPENLTVDAEEILSLEHRRLPAVYLEHNTPKPDAVNTLHPAVELGNFLTSNLHLVHVTHFNQLMWDNGDLPTTVVEHSVAIARDARYSGEIAKGIVVVNGIAKRPRIAGLDVLLEVRQSVPLDIVGMETEELGGLGDVPYRHLHELVGRYRFLFSPIRYTSLPLAVIEAMTLRMPVVALATTELPTVVPDGVAGYLSCDVNKLIAGMSRLLEDPNEAGRLGNNAGLIAQERFGLERFRRDWNEVIENAIVSAAPGVVAGGHPVGVC